MKKCSICNSEYDSRIEYCFRDGSLLDQGSATSTPKMVTSQLSSMEDPIDMMQTMDNISIDDILQIGGQSGFQGFGQFTPIEAPASKDGDTMSMSRSSLREMLEAEEQEKPKEQDQDVSSFISDDSAGLSDSGKGLNDSFTQDVEDVLDSFGSEIGAHLDDTLDGVQVGQLMDSSGLSMDDTNEILPGDTLDLTVDDLDVPEMSEGDLSRFNQQDLGAADKWEASGPIMQDAARQALEEHRKRSSHKEKPRAASSSAATALERPKPASSSKTPIFIGAAVLVVAGVVWLFSGGATDEEVVKPTSKAKREIMTPTVKKATNVNTDAPDNVEPQEQNKQSTIDGMRPTEKTPQDASATSQDINPTKPQDSTSPRSAPQKKPAPVKETVTPKQKPTVKPPSKPKTKPKPMPKKDPADKNGGQVLSGGWGASTCGVTVRSNVASAEVFVDGVRKGKVGLGITVDCGQHTLEVRSEGYTTRTRQINLTTDATYSMNLSK